MESKIIQEGTYGCVVRPPLPCAKSKAKPENVGKIIKKKNTEIELSIGTLVRGIQGWQNYYVVQDKDDCTVKNFTRLRPKYSSQCRVYTDGENSELVQLLSPFAGRAVFGLDTTTAKSFHYMASLRHMLTAVYKLNIQGVCHYDLHENNVLIDNRGILRIIDFGSAFLGDEVNEYVIKRHTYDFSPKFPPQPPELSVQNGLYRNMNEDDAIRHTIEQKHIYSKMNKLLGISIQSQLSELKEFWADRPLEGRDAREASSWIPFFKTHWRTYDSWAVGVMFLNLLEKSFLNYDFINTVWKNHSTEIRLVLKGLLHSNPFERMTAEEALSAL